MTSLALALLLCQAAPPQAEKVSFDDKLLATIPEDVSASLVAFSGDGRKVVYRGVKAGRAAIYVNGVKGPDFAAVGDQLSVSVDGQVAYCANNGQQWFAVVNHQPGPSGQQVHCPVFSPDGRKHAYVFGRSTTGRNDSTSHCVYTGPAKGPEFLTVSNPIWSADSTTLAYHVQIGKSGTAQRAFHSMNAIAVNGKPGQELDKVTPPVFAPKGNKYAYTGVDDRSVTWTLFVDGKPTVQAEEMGTPVWSPDGKRVACRTRTGNTWSIVVDGKKDPAYEIVSDPVWSPDSKQITYSAVNIDKTFIVQNGKELESYSGGQLGSPTFSPDGAHTAYPFRAPLGKWTLVRSDKKGGQADLDLIDAVTWSPDSKQVAYRAGFKYKWIIVVNDGKNELFDSLAPYPPFWSPDSQKLAYAAKKDAKWYMVVAFRRLEAFDEILTPPRWSSDSKKVAFGARKGPDLIWRVVIVPE